ncbi:MAG TPA: SpoIIE family protein phosphatase [Solirubrobacteraceae bacterium]|nr:SpoIIE family protein phosphatase [Solirubrobacteraceae bacterium]
MRRLSLFGLMAAAYALGAAAVYTWFSASGGPVFFPVAGLTVGVLIRARRGNWPAILAGAAAGELIVDLAHGNGVAPSLVWATANTVEPLLGAALLLAVCRPRAPDLGRPRDVLAFLALPVVAAPAIGGSIAGLGTALVAGLDDPGQFAARWWLGDALGVLVVAPLLLCAPELRALLRSRARTAELVLLVAGALAPVLLTLALDDVRWAYLSAVLMPWLALRTGTPGVALAAALMAMAVAGAGAGEELWVALGTSRHEGLAYVQFVIAVTAATALLLAASVSERDEAVGRRAIAESDRRRAVSRLEQEERARRRAELVASVLVDLEGGVGLRERAERLLEALVPRVADFATVEQPDGDDPVLALRHRDPAMAPLLRELREGHRLCDGDAHSLGRVASGEPLLMRSVTPAVVEEHTRSDEATKLLLRLGLRSTAAVALGRRAPRHPEPLVLLLGLSDPARRPYERDDLEFLLDLAARVTPSLEGGRELDHEHAVAAELQRALLPDRLVTHPAVAGAARYRPADERMRVGGDWYTSAALSSGRLVYAVGDVVGHGLHAAAAMGKLRTGLDALAPMCESAAELLEELDRFARGVAGAEFSTAAVVLFDPATGELRHASAGHPPILLLDAAGDTNYLMGGRSWPLCAAAAQRAGDGVLTILPGDTLLLYSDGLIERPGEALDVGMRRLSDEAAQQHGLGLDDLCEVLLETQTGGRRLRDDVVLLALRRLDPASSKPARMAPAGSTGA